MHLKVLRTTDGIRVADEYSHCDVGNWNRHVLKTASAEANFITLFNLFHLCSAHSEIAVLSHWVGLLLSIRIKHVQAIVNRKRHQWPLLLTWFNFNPDMDK